ncbi:hypothetical protein M1D80_09570 [Phyllobacteriaceae bacterium JZ32]
MVRHKGALSSWAIDRYFPHQVALLSDDAFRKRHDEIAALAKELLAAPLGHSVRHEGQWYTVYCFTDPESANTFRERFDGVPFNPKDRGKGTDWSRWRKLPWNREIKLRELPDDATFAHLTSWEELYAYCLGCGHIGLVDRQALNGCINRKTRLRSLERRLRCSKCKIRGDSMFGVASAPR